MFEFCLSMLAHHLKLISFSYNLSSCSQLQRTDLERKIGLCCGDDGDLCMLDSCVPVVDIGRYAHPVKTGELMKPDQVHLLPCYDVRLKTPRFPIYNDDFEPGLAKTKGKTRSR